MTHTRRDFLSSMATLAATSAVLTLTPPGLVTSAFAAQVKPRTLVFEHTHTGKRLRITYANGNTYVPEALRTLNSFLRDHYSGTIGRMDPKLFDLLYRLKIALGTDQPFQIISAYRCPATNDKLRKNGKGVAKRSLHMEGKAIDVRVPGVALGKLRDTAIASRSGGVGYYPKSPLVHVDTGPVRNW